MYSFPSFLSTGGRHLPVLSSRPGSDCGLGADVGHVETFLHGFPVPAVVAGRAHVSAVHAGAFIIVGSHSLAFGQVGVGQEFVGTAFPLYQFSGVSSHATQLGILCSRLYEVV